MPKSSEESSKNVEPTVTSSVNQTAPPSGGNKNDGNDKKHNKSAKNDNQTVAADEDDDENANTEQMAQIKMQAEALMADYNKGNTYFSLIPNFVKNFTKSKAEEDEESTSDESEADSRSSSNPGDDGGRGTNVHEIAPAAPQPPFTQSKAAMQFHPMFPQSVEIPPPLNQWHMYNKQTSFNPNPRCRDIRDPTDPPVIQAVKKPKRRKSSAKSGGTPKKKKPSKEVKEDRPLKAPAVQELPTTSAPRTNINTQPRASSACPSYNCPPCAPALNLPPCPPTQKLPSCGQPMSACVPPASALRGMNQGSYGGNGGGNGCAAAVSDPCNPCIAGGLRQGGFGGNQCPDMYPQPADYCNPSVGCQQQPVNCAPVELCEKSVCYCEKCENPDPNVPPQYNMQQWTCKFLRPVEGGRDPYGGGMGGGYDGGFGGGTGMPQGNNSCPGGPGLGGPQGMGGMGMPMGTVSGLPGQSGGSTCTAMGFNPNCNPACNPACAGMMQQQQMQQPQMQQMQQPQQYGGNAPPYNMQQFAPNQQYQSNQGPGCPPPGGYTGCPPGGNPPPAPRCPLPCAPRCPPRCCYQKTFTDWGERPPVMRERDRDALMSRITVQPQRQHQRQPQRPLQLGTPLSLHSMGYNPNANMVAYHPEMLQVTGAISAPPARFDESFIQQVPPSPRYAPKRTPQISQYKRNRMYMKEPTAMDIIEPELLNTTRSSQLRYHHSQQKRTEATPRVTTKKVEIYNGDIDWRSEPKQHSSETVASKLRRQHNRNKLKEINDG